MAGHIWGMSDNLTPQEEQFAQGCVALTNQSAAYRQAYNVSPDTKWTTVASEASRIAAKPHVAARIAELRQIAAERTAIPALEVRIRELRELETADPREIVGIHWGACRYCYGIDHHYQWSDDLEYAQACDEAVKVRQPLPDMTGGFEFSPLRDPHPECPRCFGIGIQRPYVTDTRKLSKSAARLYKGVKIKGNGDIEILLHDQQKATDMLNRIQGAYKDGAALPAVPPAQAAMDATQAKTPEERQRAYLRLVSG
jgi:phage terminase small subunit